ncbi:MAG: hypothetical protein F2602_01540 [Actinobacteria bacterium]|uniref:Unannotated protein n=1 Tax=freshwater metagenome TaxID=449393 RepID=A0A6J6I3F2_9ZZZZ|nr:hypothetical protein [Actinomycetota bacterium]MTA20827.1 hypothetical protein [Actinomycetota bacterium]
MKRSKSVVAIVVTLFLLSSGTSYAAPKKITLQTGSVLPAPISAESFLQSGKNAVFLSNTVNQTLDISLQAIDITGSISWERTIDSGNNEVATTFTLDTLGNFWIGGNSAPILMVESSTVILGADNPDGVSLEDISEIRADLNQLTIWNVSPTGELLATYIYPMVKVPTISAISATTSGISIVGSLDSKPFLMNMSNTGTFSKVVNVGTSKTTINSVVRQSDGSSFLFGSSAETLGGKKVAGKRDGILIKLSKSGAITTVVRSSANGAVRSWNSATPSNLLSGQVIAGKTSEVAITKFSNNFAPSWTARFPGTGSSIVVTNGANSYLAFTTRSAIPGINLWKPTTPSLLVLTFDGKGVIKAAHAFPGLVTPINLQFSRERGVVGLASSSDGTISIFTLVSR